MEEDKRDAADVAHDAADNQAETSELNEIPDKSGEESPSTEASDDLLADAEQVEALKDQLLRAKAEMENVRRRAARDVENAHRYALDKFAADLLPVLDSLEKAVEAAVGTEVVSADALAEGVELSVKLFLNTLEKAGIIQVDPHGEPFDPQLHEAIAMVPNPDLEPNSVMEVMQKGYTLNGRLVRAAKVVVTSAVDRQPG